MRAKLLIVDDEPAIREMVGFQLRRFGYSCRGAADAEEAADAIQQQRPDLILLDWMMPGKSGIEFAQELRSNHYTQDIPIILLTARGEENDKITGFGAGADDYITKPFSSKELMARIKAVLRRTAPAQVEEPMELDGLRLDPNTHEAYSGTTLLRMGPTEFRLLRFFMSHPERVFSRQQIIDNVWDTNTIIEDRTVDVHIRRLRQALAASGHDSLIQTVRGTGYRLVAKGS
jgi:two-component system phosphate regulon response regulator PhoB